MQFVLGLVILSCAFAALLKYLPDGAVHWSDAGVGSVIAAVLFSIGKKLFALYLAHAGTANAFGAAGSLAVLLMWLYFAGAVLLLGAEAAASRLEARDGEETSVNTDANTDRTAMHAPASAFDVSDGGGKTKAEAASSLPSKHATNTTQPAVSRPSQASATCDVPTILSVIKANPWRMAAAAVGAAIFVVVRGREETRKPHIKSGAND